MHQKAADIGEGDDEAQHQNRRQQVPAAGQQAACFDRDGRQDFHVRQAFGSMVWAETSSSRVGVKAL